MPKQERFSNWLFTLLEGVLLLVFSYFIFTQPAALFEQLVFAGGFVSLAIGVVNAFRYFFGEASHRTLVNLVSSVMLAGMGMLLLTGTAGAKEWIMVLLTGALLLLTVHVFLSAWDVKYQFNWWWLNILLLAFSLFTAYLVVSRQSMFGISLSFWTGLQVLLLGLMTIWISLTDRRIGLEYKQTLRQLKQQ
jgi:uncharacterized membrane protein HdeD (DUF308 family)